MNNSEAIVRALDRAGVRWVFGVPSGPVLPLIEALRRSALDFVLTASETSAGFMATVVGYLTGVPGVCISTVGPGATNLTTGVGCAWLDRAPVIAITCNVSTPWLERRIQMRIDHHALFKPLTKATIAFSHRSAEATVRRAIAIAMEDPPGPVHLDLPEDIAQANADAVAQAPHEPSPRPDLSSELTKILSIALAQARRPLVITCQAARPEQGDVALERPCQASIERHQRFGGQVVSLYGCAKSIQRREWLVRARNGPLLRFYGRCGGVDL